MKNIIITSTIVFLTLFGTAQAQEFNPDKNNYLVLSKNINQLKPVLLTAHDLAAEDGNNFGTFHLIICGKTVKDIPNNDAFKTLLVQAKNQGVKVFVCGLSLKKFNIDYKQLPSELIYTKNGILYGFQLTKKGFMTLTI